ncbi:DUF4974 domain-containing protein [Mucilaginibacter achroorhodeus]|uniref:DUF4974 domain-containing protein n=1 Tax=Mucilaginibacter achroorhodeus TaxID=2599294 RepID=A0A563U1Q9_9SPHI|nr:FecR domain-containing protein [Mucilaginibacter achroorhodeus]TWR24992.1 DUF4974 domain-containing protein [Mucilaginibacter achroorhodeus]
MNWELLIRYLNNETTVHENETVQAWLNEQSENKLILKQLQNKQTQLSEPVKEDVVQAEWTKLVERIFEQPAAKTRSINKLYTLTGIAATVLLACFMGWFAMNNKGAKPAAPVLVKSISERREVILPDGSKVFMAPNSNLEISGDFNAQNRQVKLTGEAFFNVKHNAKKPFVITTTNQTKVNVLGTSFNVYSRAGLAEEVKVATGLVGVVSDNKTTFLKAGEQLSQDVIKHDSVKSRTDMRDAQSLLNGTLYFSKSSINQVADKLERYYNINIQVAPSAAKRAAFTGEMKDYGITKVLDGIGFATGTKYKFINPQTILLF